MDFYKHFAQLPKSRVIGTDPAPKMAGGCLAQAFSPTMEHTGGDALTMAQNGQNRTSAPQEVNPAHIVSVKDFSPDTLRNVIAHLKSRSGGRPPAGSRSHGSGKLSIA